MKTELLKRHIKSHAVISASLILLLSPISYAKNTADNFRNKRYCEVVVGHGLSASVYSSIGLNDCPQNLWKRVSKQNIKKQTNRHFIYLNGPRYFVIDGAVNTQVKNENIEVFGGIQMREVGAVKLTFKDILKGFRPYVEHQVARKSTWVYKAGMPVFELISPSNKVYVMQSYSEEMMKLTVASLPNIGANLKLPRGWKFKTGTLKKDTNLITVNNMAVVTQDDLKNTYQLASHDFLG